MIDKVAISSGEVSSEFLDLNHTSELKIRVFPMIPKFATETSGELG